MKAVNHAKYMDEELVLKKGVELLVRELGPVEALRFMSFARERKMDGIKKHRSWQKQLDKDQFFSLVFE